MYHTLKTRPLKPQVTKTHDLRYKLLDILMDSFDQNAFSTFPYIRDGYTSKQAIKETNSGNCIALSMYLKDQLHKRYGVRSHLVPATVPSHIHIERYLDICHVSLIIPINASSYYLIDPAFYFLEPILIRTKSPKSMSRLCPAVRSVNIYDNVIDTIHPTLKEYDARHKLNHYQAMPKGTQYCECYYNTKSDDTWKYYLREIVNPDQAITTFFITIRKDPFFVSTKVENGTCTKDIIVRTYDGDHVSIKQGEHTLYDGSSANIPVDVIQDLSHTLQDRGFDEEILIL
jgi:hypothetical protein